MHSSGAAGAVPLRPAISAARVAGSAADTRRGKHGMEPCMLMLARAAWGMRSAGAAAIACVAARLAPVESRRRSCGL